MADCFLMKNGGSGTSFTYGENIFDYTGFKESVGSDIYHGTIEWDDENESFTLIANKNDCYTQQNASPIYYLKSGTTYELSFDLTFNGEAENKNGRVLVLYKGSTSTMYDFGTNSKKRFIFTSFFSSSSTSEYIKIRFGGVYANISYTYSNIQLREVLSLGD